MLTRFLRAAAAATLLLTLGSSLVAAGGWATVVADDAAPPEPRAGEEVEYGFTVLQHGVTPAGWEEPTLHLTNTITGESFDVPAEPAGKDGHFVARVTFPSGGSWSWSVRLRDLLVETQPVTGLVLEADGTRPAVDLGTSMAALERAKAELSEALRSEFLPRIDRLERDLGGLQETTTNLRGQVRALTAERDELAAQLSAATAGAPAANQPETIPPLGVATLAILGGALAGFAMAWLGMRREPVAVTPASPHAPVEPVAAAGGRPIATT